MIVDEILEVIQDGDRNGKRLNELVDQFREGRDANELAPVLGSENDEVVSIALWILAELPESLYNTTDIVSRLQALTEHDEPSVRFNAFSAVYPLLNPMAPATDALLARLLTDPNPGVRRIAAAAAARMGRGD